MESIEERIQQTIGECEAEAIKQMHLGVAIAKKEAELASKEDEKKKNANLFPDYFKKGGYDSMIDLKQEIKQACKAVTSRADAIIDFIQDALLKNLYADTVIPAEVMEEHMHATVSDGEDFDAMREWLKNGTSVPQEVRNKWKEEWKERLKEKSAQ